MDENKNIITTGDLVDGTYTYWYEDKNGKLVEIGTIEIGGVSYKNWIRYGIDTDESIYNGVGYKTASRINSSGDVADVANTSASNPAFATGFIPVKTGDIFRLKNCYIDTDGMTDEVNYWGGDTGALRICLYNKANYSYADIAAWNAFLSWDLVTATADENGRVTEFTITREGVNGWLRFTLGGDPETAIMTINEEISEEEPAYTNLFDAATATLNTRMSGSSGEPKGQDGYVMTAIITLPESVDIVSGAYDENTPYIAVPADMWSGSANMFGKKEDGSNVFYVSSEVTAGTTVGAWKKIPVYNQWGGSHSAINLIVVSLYVKEAAITEDDIQGIKIYFNEIPGQSEDNTPTSIDILDTYELQLNKRWSASGKKWSDCNGMLSIVVPFADIKDRVVQFTGFQKITTADSNSPRWYVTDSSGSTQYGCFMSATVADGTTDDVFSSKLVNEGNGTYSIAITSENIGVYNNASAVQVMMCMPVNSSGTVITEADLANFSMVINEPIV